MSYVRSLTIPLIAALVFAGAITNASIAEAKSVAGMSAHGLTATLEVPKHIFQSSISLSQAVAMMQAKYGAKSMRATTSESGGRVVYEIRLRSADGSRVWTVYVDAASGREM